MLDTQLCILSIVFKYTDLYSKIKLISLNKHIFNNRSKLYLCTTRNQTLLTMNGIEYTMRWTNNYMYKVKLFYTYIKYLHMNYHIITDKDRIRYYNYFSKLYKKCFKLSKKTDKYIIKYCDPIISNIKNTTIISNNEDSYK